MKKWLIVLCALMMLTMANTATAHEVYTSGDWEYILLDEGRAEIVNYKGSAENVKVPSRIGKLMVTAIGKEAFLDAGWSVRDITIPEGVTSIGDRAFAGCHILRSINFPNSLTQIGADIFLDCCAGVDIQIAPDHPVLEIVDGVLYEKTADRLICMLSTRLGGVVVQADGSVDYSYTYVIPEGICEIDDGAFNRGDIEDENGVTLNKGNITIPESVKAIGKRAFAAHLHRLTVIPGSYAEQYAIDNNIPYVYGKFNPGEYVITSLEFETPKKCGNYQYVVLRDGTAEIVQVLDEKGEVRLPFELDGYRVTSIGQCCLYYHKTYDTAPSSILVPDSVTYISRFAFADCSTVTEITIPDSVTYIGEAAFYGCRALTSVTIPDSVKYIGDSLLGYSPNAVLTITPGSYAEQYAIENNIPYVYAGFNPGEYVVTSQDVEPPEECGNYQYIVLQDGTAEIVRVLHADDNMVLPDELDGYRVSSIGQHCFTPQESKDAAPTCIVIPDSVVYISRFAFSDCRAATIIIPDGVTYIAAAAFYGAEVSEIVIPKTVTAVQDGTFAWCRALTNVTIPDSVTCIGKDAFRDCWSLKNVVIPGEVTAIGENAFASCQELTLTVIPGSYAEQYAIDNNIPYVYAAEAAPADDFWDCTCGSHNTGKFCPECGTKKPEAPVEPQCSSCGYKPEGAAPKFCPECGTKF